METVLKMEGITIQRLRALANDHVDFDLKRGEVHALLGENGAGKTTLMEILFGHLVPDRGKIFLDGEEAQTGNPAQAIKLGIGMVHQHLQLVERATVTENVILGREPKRGPFLNTIGARNRVEKLIQRYGLDLNPKATVATLPANKELFTELLKVLYRKAKIVALDEPTANLTPQEVEQLFTVIRALTQEGKSVIFITHKLHEALAIADRITVLRSGKVIGTVTPDGTSEKKLAEMMVGNALAPGNVRQSATPGPAVLQILGLRTKGQVTSRIRGIDLTVKSGEILGIAGVQGNGQDALVETLLGLRPFTGWVQINDTRVKRLNTREVLELGVACIPGKREQTGLVRNFTLAENLCLLAYRQPPIRKGAALSWSQARAQAEKLAQQFGIVAPGLDYPLFMLSGGNQQRVVLARELSRPVKLLIANQPTRGLDISATEYTHRQLLNLRATGCGILLISADLDELLKLSDRIAVMYEGRIVGTFPNDNGKELRNRIGLLMAGGRVTS